MKHVLLVGGHDDTFNHYEGLNLRFTVLQLVSSLGPNLQSLTEQIHIVPDLSSDTVHELVTTIHMNDPIDYLFSFTEDGLLPAALTAKKLGICGIDLNACELCIDKAKMRKHLEGTMYEIKSALCHSFVNAKEFLREHPEGIVLKDPKGSGSENVYFVKNDSDISTVFESYKNHRSPILAEEFIDGLEVSVETLTIRGNHEVISITSKNLYRNTFAEQEHIVPEPQLSVRQRTDLANFCIGLLSVINYQHGPCHIEVKISSNGMKLIEINNRVGGAYIGHLAELVYGVNLFRETLAFFADGQPDHEKRQSHKKYQYAATHLFFECIQNVVIKEALTHIDIIKFHLNSTTVNPNAIVSNSDGTGIVVIASNDKDKFFNAIEKLRQLTS